MATTPKENLIEEIFAPDLTRNVSVIKDQLVQNNLLLGALAKQLGLPEIVSAQSTTVSSKASAFSARSHISLPMEYTNLLEILLAARKAGDVFPYFVRSVTTVQAGTTTQIETTVPPGDIASVVYLLKLRVDTDSSEFLVTLQVDNLPPLFVEAPMTVSVDIQGAFLPPTHTKGTYILTNNDSVDITFTEDVQLAVMTSDFVKAVWTPLLNGQYNLITDLAEIMQSGGLAS